MPLPAKRKTPTGEPKKAVSKMGMTKADSGKGPAANKLNRGVGGLSDAQAEGGEEPEISKKAAPKKKPKRTSQGIY